MATITWGGTTGDWATASKWVGGTAPGSADTALINGTTTATIAVKSADAALGVDLTDANATLAIDSGGTLALGSTMTLSAGTLQLNSYGVISGGTISASGGKFVANYGMLNGVTFEGTLDMSATRSYLLVGSYGLVLKGAGGVGSGSVDLTGASAVLQVNGSQTLDNATISMGNNAAIVGGSGTLTLGSGLDIVQAVSGAEYIGLNQYYMVNEGVINAAYAAGGARVVVDSTTFVNLGTLNAANADILTVQGAFTNTGVMSLASGGQIVIRSSISSLGSVVNTGGTLVIGSGGALNNAGATLAVGAGSKIGALAVQSGGMISGGTIADGGSGLLAQHGTLNGVTFEGTLDLLATSASVTVGASGVVLTGAGGVGAGSVNLTGYGSSLEFYGSQTLNNATISMGDNASIGAVPPGTLTFGSGLDIVQAGLHSRILSGGGEVINQGVINATYAAGGAFFVYQGAFVNQGTVNVANADHFTVQSYTFSNTGSLVVNGGTVTIASTTFTNFSAGKLSGGTFEVEAGSTLQLPNNQAITSDNATLILSGAGSVIESFNTKTSVETQIDTSMTAINGAGTLELLSGRNWASKGTFTNAGQLILGGTSFSATTLNNSGTVSGSGTITGAINNTGAVETGAGQTLNLTGATLTNLAGGVLTGGTLEAQGGGVLQLANNLSITTLAATAILSGAGSQIQSLNTGSSSQVTLDQSLTSIAAGGNLEILGGRSLVANPLNVAGGLQLGGGALSGGAVSVASGGVVTGFGTVASAVTVLAGGEVLANGASALSLTAGGVVNAGTLATNAAGGLSLSGAVANSGAILIESSSLVTTQVRVTTAGATLSGGGTVVLSGSHARLMGSSTATVLVNVDNTISGTGSVGLAEMAFTNDAAGVVDATTGVLTLRDGAGAAVTNNGLLEASGAGSLSLVSETINQAGGGTILAAGRLVTLQGVDIVGGTLAVTGAGKMNLGGTGAELDGSASTVTNSGVVQSIGGVALTVNGAIANSGKINLNNGKLIVGAAGATLSGGGSVNLNASATNTITGSLGTVTLTNVDNRIDGAGQFGAGSLILVNDAGGVIVGNQTTALTINTGANTIINAGVIQNVGKGGTTIASALNNTGTLAEATAGTLTVQGQVSGSGAATINGGALYVVQAFAENVTFNGTTGVLKLGDSQAYTGQIKGLSTSGTNSLDLADIVFNGSTKASYSGTAASGTLTVTDGTHTATITLLGNYLSQAFTVSSDGHGGTTVVDPPAGGAPSAAPLAQAMAGFQHGPAPHLAVLAAYQIPRLPIFHVRAA